MKKRLVILESPFKGGGDTAITYARRAMRDSLLRGEAPLASHLLYTQEGVLDDDVPEERERGIEAGLAWGRNADATVLYDDYGISEGMGVGLRRAIREDRAIEFRSIGLNPTTTEEET